MNEIYKMEMIMGEPFLMLSEFLLLWDARKMLIKEHLTHPQINQFDEPTKKYTHTDGLNTA